MYHFTQLAHAGHVHMDSAASGSRMLSVLLMILVAVVVVVAIALGIINLRNNKAKATSSIDKK